MENITTKFVNTCKQLNEKRICNGDCCGMIPIDKDIVKKHEKKQQQKVIEIIAISEKKIIPITTDTLCIFLNRKTKRCVIYKDRPELCRKYGLIEELQCPYINTNGNERSEAKKRRMQRKINHEVKQRIKKIMQKK